MAKDHRFFHRRRAAPFASPTAVTVKVHVVATISANASLLAHDTHAPTPPVTPSAHPLSSLLSASDPLLPSVPAVPSFPTNLRDPSVVPYPWPSDVAAAQAVGSTAAPLAVPAPTTPQSRVSQNPLPPFSSTSQPSAISDVPSSLLLSTSSLPSQRSIAAPSELYPSYSLASSSAAGAESIATTSDTASSTLSPVVAAGGSDGPAYTVAPTAATTGASINAHVGGGVHAPSLKTPKVVGSVIGSLAGAAFLLAIILILIRRHKDKRGGALQLIGEEHPSIDSKQSMRQVPPSSNAMPSSFLSRFSTVSRSTVETTFSGGERGFQKVSGRKLPSIFSEGMTSEQFASRLHPSEASFYPDEKERGVHGSPGKTKEFEKEAGHIYTTRESGPMNIRPGPARTPVVRYPDENPFADLTYLSPPQTPNRGSPRGGSLGRSLASADGSRSSRFTENV